jgi:hypothetical protein
MINFCRINGQYIVRVKGEQYTLDTLHDAWVLIFAMKGVTGYANA